MKKRIIVGLSVIATMAASTAMAGTVNLTGSKKYLGTGADATVSSPWTVAQELVSGAATDYTTADLVSKFGGIGANDFYVPSEYAAPNAAIIPYTDTAIRISVDKGTLQVTLPSTQLQLCAGTGANDLVAAYASGAGTNSLLFAAVGVNGTVMTNGGKYVLREKAPAGGADCADPLGTNGTIISAKFPKADTAVTLTVHSYKASDPSYGDTASTSLVRVYRDVQAGFNAVAPAKYDNVIDPTAVPPFSDFTVVGHKDTMAIEVFKANLDESIVAGADTLKIVIAPTTTGGLATTAAAQAAGAVAAPSGKTGIAAVATAIPATTAAISTAAVSTFTITTVDGTWIGADSTAPVTYTFTTEQLGTAGPVYTGNLTPKSFTMSFEVTAFATAGQAPDTIANGNPPMNGADAGKWSLNGFQALVPYIYGDNGYRTTCVLNNTGSNPADVTVDIKTLLNAAGVTIPVPASLTGMTMGQVPAGQQMMINFDTAGVTMGTTVKSLAAAGVSGAVRFSAQITATGVTTENVYGTCFQNTPTSDVKRNVPLMTIEDGAGWKYYR